MGRLCPVIAGGVCVGSLYWTCVTYGAVTVMQVREFGTMVFCFANIVLLSTTIVHHHVMLCKCNVFVNYDSPSFCDVSQVAGHSDGLTLMENADPLLLLVSLPLVPLGLVLGKMVGFASHPPPMLSLQLNSFRSNGRNQYSTFFGHTFLGCKLRGVSFSAYL